MPNCKLNGCNSKFGKGGNISLFSVPSTEPNRSKWIEAIEKVQPFDHIVQTYHVCQSHFLPQDIGTRGKNKYVISGRVPLVFPNKHNENNNLKLSNSKVNTDDESCNNSKMIKPSLTNDIEPIPSTCYDVDVNCSNLEYVCEVPIQNLADSTTMCESVYDSNDQIASHPENLEHEQDISVQPIRNSLTNPDENHKDEIRITKAEYKKFLDDMVELAGLRIKMTNIEKKFKEKSDEIKVLQRKIRYLEHKQENSNSEERKCQKSSTKNNSWDSIKEDKIREVLEYLMFGRSCKKISPNMRLFCITLHYYNPKAYEYVRSFFNLNLPSIRTIRKWYSVIDGSPGFTESAFSVLKQKADESKAEGKPLVVCLIHDDMHIRKHSQWSSEEGKFLGHINAGKPGDHEVCSPLATQANVLMVSGIGNEFVIPIGYFLNNGLCAEERAAILYEAMLKLHNVGAIVGAITNDGNIGNISTAKILGSNYGADKPYFTNPFNKEHKVYLVLDPPHMLKLSRNCIANKTTIYDGENNEISWKFFEELVSLQISENVNFGNKLTKSHIEYESTKMNVRLAAETLSRSTAASIEYLNKVMKHEKFRNGEGTSQYSRVFNNTFDIMNTKRKHCDDDFKRPMSEANINEIRTYFEFVRNYINGLQLIENGQKKPILRTRSFTPYFGFYHNTISLMGIYDEYIKPNGIDEFYTFNLSQDHLESFFGCVRRMGGCNDNPTEQQFKGAYRKLLLHNEVVSGRDSNCLNDITKVLHVSSAKSSSHTPTNQDELEMLANYDFENHIEYEDVRFPHENDLRGNSMAFIASIVEEKVLKKINQKGYKRCTACMHVFLENEITEDSFIQYKIETSNTLPPCRSTIELIQSVDTILKIYDTQNVSFNSMLVHIMKNINLDQFYGESVFDREHDHQYELIELVIRTYMDIKSRKDCKLITRLSQSTRKRHTNLKEVHRLGQ